MEGPPVWEDFAREIEGPLALPLREVPYGYNRERRRCSMTWLIGGLIYLALLTLILMFNHGAARQNKMMDGCD